MNDWQQIEMYWATQMEELRRESDENHRLGHESRSRRNVARWIVIAALIMSLSAWWIL